MTFKWFKNFTLFNSSCFWPRKVDFFWVMNFLHHDWKKKKRTKVFYHKCLFFVPKIEKKRKIHFGWNVVTFVLLPKVCLHLVALKEFLLNSFFYYKSSLLNAKYSLGWWVSTLTLKNGEETTNEERQKVRTLLLDVVKQ
jgi:hypothetical protein